MNTAILILLVLVIAYEMLTQEGIEMKLGQTIKKADGWYVQCNMLIGPFHTKKDALEMFGEWLFEAMAS